MMGLNQQKSRKAKILSFLGRLLFVVAVIMFLCGIIVSGIMYSEWLIALILVLSSIVLGILGIFIYIYAIIVLPVREATQNMNNMFAELGDGNNLNDMLSSMLGDGSGLDEMFNGNNFLGLDNDEDEINDEVYIICGNCGETVNQNENICGNCNNEI